MSKNYVFLDTCVIQHAGSSDKGKSEAIVEMLNGLSKEGYNLAISEFTIYENLQGLWGERVKKAMVLLDKFEQKIVSKLALTVASILGGIYHAAGTDVSDGDKIIAATTILEKGFVLTENHKDFPSPFFVREKYLPVTYDIGSHHNKTLDFVLYRPDMQIMSHRFSEYDRTK